MNYRFFAAAALAVVFFSPVQPAVAAGAGDDPVIATVNGTEIHLSQVEEARTRLPARYKELPPEAVYGLLVNSIVDTNLLAAEARKRGFNNKVSHKRKITRIENQLLERALLARHIKEGLTDEALKARYKKYTEESSGRQEVRARHILVDSEDKAKELIAKIKDGGDFAELAGKHSIGPSKSSGGDLGFFGEGQMVPAFSNAAFSMDEGQFTETPVKTSFGWHVIKVEERRQGKTPAFEDAKEEIKSLLSNEIGGNFIKKLRASAEIKVFQPDGSPLPDGAKTK